MTILRSLLAAHLLLIGLAGCESGKTEAEPTKPASEQKVPEIPEAQVVKQDPPEEKAKDPRFKEQRIYQLADLKVGKVRINGKEFKAWLADTPGKQQEGMMWLLPEDVKDDEGMLFLMPEAAIQSFWMRNCPMALDIIYISEDRKILNIGEGKPYDETGVPSEGPAKYVFELKAGMAKKFGIRPGQTFQYELPK